MDPEIVLSAFQCRSPATVRPPATSGILLRRRGEVGVTWPVRQLTAGAALSSPTYTVSPESPTGGASQPPHVKAPATTTSPTSSPVRTSTTWTCQVEPDPSA